MLKNNTPEPYSGIPRVTNIIKEIFGEPEQGWLSYCGECRKKNLPTEQEILEWSSEFGSVLHSRCLENVGLAFSHPDFILYNSCANIFEKFKKEFAPKTIEVEKIVYAEDEFRNKIYAGTLDWLCYIKGEKWIIDLKTWGSWRWKFGYQSQKKNISGNNGSKTNLQTELYVHALEEKVKRGVLWINPEFYIFKEFNRSSNKFEQAIEIAKKLSSNNVNLQW